MAETPAAAAAVEMEFGPHPHDMLTLDGELLRVLITGDSVRLEETLREAGYGGHPRDGAGSPPHEVPPLVDGHRDPQTDGLELIAINLPDAAPVVVEAGISPSRPNSGADLTGYLKPCIAACLSSMARWCRARAVPRPARDVDPPVPITVAPEQHGRRSSILGVTSNGNTALHVVASRGHANLAALICERVPSSLVATRNRCLDTPLHCAAKAGHRSVAECLLQTIQAGTEAEATLQARNQAGATALHEAVRHGHVDVVDLLMMTAPWLASVTTDGGVSALYMAAASHSVEMVQRLLRPSQNGRPSPPASAAGPGGRTALHVAALSSTEEIAREILNWEPEGPTLLTRVDASGRTPLHFAVSYGRLHIVQLFLSGHASLSLTLTSISDNDGSYPVHAAAMYGITRIIDELVKKCPHYYEQVDDRGRNLLHLAVENEQETVVRHICQNDTFVMLLNATDSDGNTPLHLAVKNGYPRIVGLLLGTARVDMCITNNDGCTPTDLSCSALAPGGIRYFLDPRIIVFACLWWVRAPSSLDHRALHMDDDTPALDDEATQQQDNMTKNGTIASVLIATVAFAAAFTVPGGFITDDHPHAGTAILARQFAFRAFVVVDTMAFLCSIVATCFLIYGNAREIPRRHRRIYNLLASGLVPWGAQFLIGTFPLGFHLVMGGANRGLVIFVYTMSSAAVLFCFPGIWGPFCLGLGTAIWRRSGWRGIVNIHKRPSSLKELFILLFTSPLIQIRRTLVAVLISTTFIVVIVLDIYMPNY